MSRRLRSWLQAWLSRQSARLGASHRAPNPARSRGTSIGTNEAGQLDATAVPVASIRSGDPRHSLVPASHEHNGEDHGSMGVGREADAHEIEAIVGIDFGTSSTKIVIRLPYEQGEPAFAVPAIEAGRAEGDPDLWVSRVWLDRDAGFRLDASEGAETLDGLKAAVMRDADVAVTRSRDVLAKEAVCALLALLINEARRWFLGHHQDVLAGGQVHWSYHFGFPAASLDTAPLREHYQQCAAAALLLAQGGSISLTGVREALDGVAGDSECELRAREGALFPEVAAAVAGFAHTQRREDGLYALIDVGAGTLDCCTFNLSKTADGVMRCPIFAADVAMLGVEPWQACRNMPARRENFRKELDRRPRTVIWRTRQRRYPDSPRWTTALPLFLIGGGAASEVHRSMAEGLNGWIRNHLKTGSGGVRLLELPLPENFLHRCGPERVQRLAVAVGLSLPNDMIPQVELPHVIDDVAPPPKKPIDELYIDKSMV